MPKATDCDAAQTLIDFPRNIAPQRSAVEVRQNVEHVVGCELCMTYALRDGVGPALDKLFLLQEIHPDMPETA